MNNRWLDKEKLIEALEEERYEYDPIESEFARGVNYVTSKFLAVIKLHTFDAPEANQLREENAKLVEMLKVYVGESMMNTILSELRGGERNE